MTQVREVARVFSTAKRVESAGLNAIGVQPARAVLARALYRLRPVPNRRQFGSMARTLSRDGIVTVPNFLPSAVHGRLRDEAREVFADPSRATVHRHGDTRVEQFRLDDLDPTAFPSLSSWLSGSGVALAVAAERRRLAPGQGLRVLERVVHGDLAVPDPETDLHVDTFFNTHKLWLYLNDVKLGSGPLAYVPRSHRLSLERLRREYVDSRHPTASSRRVDREELERRGLTRQVITSAANTLVIVNTCGYHARTRGTPGATREALHMSFRFNPFLPTSVRVERRFRRPRPTAVLETSP